MKRLQILLLVAASIPVFAQHPVRRGEPAKRWQPKGEQIGSVQFGSRKLVKPRAATNKAAAAPAAGVVQLHVEEGKVFAFFVATGNIPSGTDVQVTITADNGSDSPTAIQFDPVSYSFTPGQYITLPTLENMFDLDPSLLITYTVDLTNRGNTSEANGFFLVGSTLGYNDLASFAPVITGTSQKIASNRDMILVINGFFTSDTPLVVLEGSVAPANAITLVSSSEIDVDLSQVSGLDLTGLNEYLLTVSQAGFADTIVYRYAPGVPNSFNQAPQ